MIAQPTDNTNRPGRLIIRVTAALLVLLALSVVLSLFHLGRAALPGALAIALIKTAIIGAWFMELRRAPAIIRVVALAGSLWLLLLLAGTLADVLTRTLPARQEMTLVQP